MNSGKMKTFKVNSTEPGPFTLRSSTFLLLLVAGDVCLVLAVYMLVFWLRSLSTFLIFWDRLPLNRFFFIYTHHPFILIGTLVGFYYVSGLYSPVYRIRFNEIVGRCFSTAGVHTLSLISVYYLSNDLIFPRSFFPFFWLGSGSITALWRITLLRLIREKGVPRRVILIGSSPLITSIIAEIQRVTESSLTIVGVVSRQTDDPISNQTAVPYLGSLHQLPALIEKHHVNELILAPFADWRDELFLLFTSDSFPQKVRLSIVPSLYEMMLSKMHQLKIHDVPLIQVLDDQPNVVTRAFEFLLNTTFALFGATLTVLLSVPLMVINAITSPGPLFYSQKRVGKGQRHFQIIKFRTMVCGAESESGPVLAKDDDDRITWIGRFLRRWRLDELPQSFNILQGDMALIGPRPERPFFVEKYLEKIAGYQARFRIKPGITGLAQVNGDYKTKPEYKLRYDLAYLFNRSMWLDLVILAETVRILLSGEER